MTKHKMEYVHVLDRQTRKSIHCVGPTDKAERTARGMAINLDTDKYELAISPDKEWSE